MGEKRKISLVECQINYIEGPASRSIASRHNSPFLKCGLHIKTSLYRVKMRKTGGQVQEA